MSQVIDTETFTNIKEIMEDRFETLLETYLKNAKNYISQIKDGYNAKDAKKIEHAAHPLKGSSASMGITAIQELAGDIEEIAVNSQEHAQTLEQIPALIQSLEKIFEDVEREIKNIT